MNLCREKSIHETNITLVCIMAKKNCKVMKLFNG